MATQQEVIKAFMQSLDKIELSGRAALDEAVRASSNFSSYQEVANQFLEDQMSANNWHRFLVEKTNNTSFKGFTVGGLKMRWL